MCDHFGSKFGLIKRYLKKCLCRFVTMDETCIHHHTPESREGLNEWLIPVESAPKRPKTQHLAGKVMASVFWDAHGVIFIDDFEKGRTITGAYYTVLLDRLVNEIRKKRPHFKMKKILFHDENAPSHTPNITQVKKHELSFESLPHPPFSPDLAPSYCYLFPNLERCLCGRRFESNKEILFFLSLCPTMWDINISLGLELEHSFALLRLDLSGHGDDSRVTVNGMVVSEMSGESRNSGYVIGEK